MSTSKKAPKKAAPKKAPKTTILPQATEFAGYDITLDKEAKTVSFGCGSVEVSFETVRKAARILKIPNFIKVVGQLEDLKGSVDDDTNLDDVAIEVMNIKITPAIKAGLDF